jgi:hypothetical protein
LGRLRLLLGISVFWLALSMLFDGFNTLALPMYAWQFFLGAAVTGVGVVALAGWLVRQLLKGKGR